MCQNHPVFERCLSVASAIIENVLCAGAGKSTLLDVIAGRMVNLKATGGVLLNNTPVTSQTLSANASFVAQVIGPLHRPSAPLAWSSSLPSYLHSPHPRYFVMLIVCQHMLPGAPLMQIAPPLVPVLPCKPSINLAEGFWHCPWWAWRLKQISAMHVLIRQSLRLCTLPITYSWQQAHFMPLQGRRIAALQDLPACCLLTP